VINLVIPPQSKGAADKMLKGWLGGKVKSIAPTKSRTALDELDELAQSMITSQEQLQ
jgi:hypothetical protein